MKKIGYWIAGIILVLFIIVMVYGPLNLFLKALSPSHDFETETRTTPPDYSDIANWAALPSIDDPSDLIPEGVQRDTAVADVDVFFIHPTGYLKGEMWNSDMNPNTATEENTKWMLANQASAFSDGRVYAPRYRQATIFSFFDREDEESNGSEALDLAYGDVERAFDYFINNYSNGGPFIIASHSQGSFHGIQLLMERIDGTPLADRMIAAYLVGMETISDEAVSEMSIPVCDSPDQTGCMIHWATYAEGAPEDKEITDKLVCVNPITWKKDGGKGEQELHLGYVPQSGAYDIKFHGEDTPNHTVFDKLPAPQRAYTFAYCKDGRLLVAEQSRESEFMGEGNYHGLDFLLFHMDIRKNVGDRVRAYKRAQEAKLMEEN